jgi:frataxin-like iron-binding protein CyaY
MDKLPFFEVVDQKLKNIHQNFDDLSRDYKTIISLSYC